MRRSAALLPVATAQENTFFCIADPSSTDFWIAWYRRSKTRGTESRIVGDTSGKFLFSASILSA